MRLKPDFIGLLLFYAGVIASLIWLNACGGDGSIVPGGSHLEIPGCLHETDSSTLDIITWNVRTFPVEGPRTVVEMARIIQQQDPDVIALQEVTAREVFDDLMDQLPGWKGVLKIDGDINLGILYKTAEVRLTGGPEILFGDDHEAFPRSPLVIRLRHLSGVACTLINVHLKCCGGEENEIRRRKAAVKLKKYLDGQHPGDPVMVVGDFNDRIAGVPDGENVFIDFVNDTLNYRFADMEIARGSQINWSYPSWPNHIDHVLITDELFTAVLETTTLLYDFCDYGYFNTISDHRPVMVRLK